MPVFVTVGVGDQEQALRIGRLHKPLDPKAFTTGLREEMRTELAALNDALPDLDWLQITDCKSGAIQLTTLDAQPQPRNLRRPEEGCPRPLRTGTADRHGHRSRSADRDARGLGPSEDRRYSSGGRRCGRRRATGAPSNLWI
jgi:hypothetical protein